MAYEFIDTNILNVDFQTWVNALTALEKEWPTLKKQAPIPIPNEVVEHIIGREFSQAARAVTNYNSDVIKFRPNVFEAFKSTSPALVFPSYLSSRKRTTGIFEADTVTANDKDHFVFHYIGNRQHTGLGTTPAFTYIDKRVFNKETRDKYSLQGMAFLTQDSLVLVLLENEGDVNAKPPATFRQVDIYKPDL